MVDILMATYNGEAFVEEQVRSIMSQSYTDWRLLVHDDGSVDATMAIIRSLAAEDNRIVLIEDDVAHLGVARNFIHLVGCSTAPFVMFCDQDDIWLSDKVETMVRLMEQCEQSQPQVVYSNAYLWNAQRGIISDKNTLTYPSTLRQALFLNTGIQGASALFNARMRELLCQPLAHYAMHDHVLLLLGITQGEVHYIHQSLMYYRQHTNNVTGNAPGSIWKKILLMWQNRSVPLVSQTHLQGVEAFYAYFKQHLTADDQQIIEAFLAMPTYGVIRRMMCVCKNHFQLFDSTILLLIKMLIRRYI